jgi:hypothetical protein
MNLLSRLKIEVELLIKYAKIFYFQDLQYPFAPAHDSQKHFQQPWQVLKTVPWNKNHMIGINLILL